MSNSFISQTNAAGSLVKPGLAILHLASQIGKVIKRDAAVASGIATGDTVTFWSTPPVAPVEFNGTVQPSDVTTNAHRVTLSHHPQRTAVITDKEATLDMVSFTEQVVAPSLVGIAHYIDGIALTAFKGTTTPVQGIDQSDPVGSILAMASTLSRNEVPFMGRSLLAGADVALQLKQSQILTQVNTSGNDDVLRSNLLGRLAGCDVFEVANAALPADECVMLQRDQAVLLTRAPQSVASLHGQFGGSSAQVYEDYALRISIFPDGIHLASQFTADTFVGCAVLRDEGVVVGKITP